MTPHIYNHNTRIYIWYIYIYISKVFNLFCLDDIRFTVESGTLTGYPVTPWKQNLCPVYYLLQPEIHYRDKHFRMVLPCKIRMRRFVPFLLHAQCPGRPFWLAAEPTQIKADHTSLPFMFHCTCFTLLPSVLLLLLGALSLGSWGIFWFCTWY